MLTSYPPLPSLSDDELREQFGDSPETLRRYRMLDAVLTQGMSQREVAETYEVSERTVRNLLSAYRTEGGLKALQGRKARRQAPRSWHLFEPALAAVLEEEPLAGGDRLWQRARAALGTHGQTLSRRTAYRILARLRDERQQSEADDSFSPLRAALSLLPEDPPLSLGASALGQRLLPDTADPLVRGTLLQQALRTALDRLRPSGEVSAISREWWPYLICSGEYEAGQSRAELQEDLALSPSTYSRAKRHGLTHIGNSLPHILQSLGESPQMRVSMLLPRAPDFVGRHEEQALYAWRLQTEGRAFLWGPAGSGKSALAAELAAEGRRFGQLVLWHTCLPGPASTLGGILMGLLRALFGGEVVAAPTDTDAALEQIRERLLSRPAVIVLDDMQRADEDEIAPLLAMIEGLLARGSVRLLHISRQAPPEGDWPPLPGLSEAEARLLWTDLPPLPDTQWKALYATTAGLPQPIHRAAAAHRRAGELARTDAWAEEVSEWANNAIWAELRDSERALLALACAAAESEGEICPEQLCKHAGLEAGGYRVLVDRDLARWDGDVLRPHPVLAPLAALLAEEPELREAHNALLASNTECPEPLDSAASSRILEAPSRERPQLAPPSLALLDRLQAALESSEDYLRRKRDRSAGHLAAELAALRAALPRRGMNRLEA